MNEAGHTQPTPGTGDYVGELGYTYGYFAELNPLRMRLALTFAGLASPVVSRACELGFGQGVSLNVHAAASRVQWWGTDFHPDHARFASELAAACGSAAGVFGEAIEDFAARTDLPDFDFIGLHGVWSWVAPEVQRQIVDFLARRLRPGGVAYLGYNALPGWAGMVPVRNLMATHVEQAAASGATLAQRITDAVAFGARMFAANPAYARGMPQLAARVEKLGELPVSYLAHEYFNGAWEPVQFSTMARALGAAGLDYGCSAHLLDHLDWLHLDADQQALLATAPPGALREDARDLMVNRQFRRDYWVKGARLLARDERDEALRATRLVMVVPRERITLTVAGALGESRLNERVCLPLVDLMSDHRPQAIRALEAALVPQLTTFEALLEALMVLVGTGQLAPVSDDADVEAAAGSAGRLNASFLQRAQHGADVSVLASPLIGGAVEVGRMSQLFLAARATLGGDSRLWTPQVWRVLEAEGHRFRKDGRQLEGAAENLQHLEGLARTFTTQALPVLLRLGMADEPGTATTG